MTRCTCWFVRLSNVLARRSVSVLVFVVLNPIHVILHGTPLDGGALDGMLQVINAWAVTEAHK